MDKIKYLLELTIKSALALSMLYGAWLFLYWFFCCISGVK
jgi:hypothetical protein